MSEVSRISDEEWGIWRTFYAMRRQLDQALEQQLQRDANISRSEFEVLISIFESSAGQLRAGELADHLGWEKSRISHLVTRMERRGLVERRDCDTDLRSSWVALTADGKRAVLGSMSDHAATIRRYFFDALTPEELAALNSTSVKVLEAIDPPVCRTGSAAAAA
ncbi:MarR family winged helix-turn-helix transcriptional regulator [Glaciihabitans sp. dw_435]|uniref:MarR family winged helix-turn-helix transcriptional regulator n=1 Tax=Glaciihabitans sp. dw_435 TaxID=2720081 RepID=UPI001BD59821|nr:MarR family transcriptional regulator [Glaciihabitans sp. dw_435]